MGGDLCIFKKTQLDMMILIEKYREGHLSWATI